MKGRYQFVFIRSVRFKIEDYNPKAMPKVREWILQYCETNNLPLFRMNLQEHYYFSKVTLWCSKKELQKFVLELGKYAGVFIREVKF